MSNSDASSTLLESQSNFSPLNVRSFIDLYLRTEVLRHTGVRPPSLSFRGWLVTINYYDLCLWAPKLAVTAIALAKEVAKEPDFSYANAWAQRPPQVRRLSLPKGRQAGFSLSLPHLHIDTFAPGGPRDPPTGGHSPVSICLIMWFMYFSTDLCSPAFLPARQAGFSPWITPHDLAACYALLGFAHQGLAPFG
jgi:hypothetical protein